VSESLLAPRWEGPVHQMLERQAPLVESAIHVIHLELSPTSFSI
jgi:hypothetical protein